MSSVLLGALVSSLRTGTILRGSLSAATPRLAPSLALDFLSGILDPRITFSRGTNATLVDSTGKITYAPNNLLTYSGFEGAVVGTPGTNPTNWPFNSAGGSITSFASGVIGFSATAARQIVGPTISIGANQSQIWSVVIVSNPNSLGFNQLFTTVNATGATVTAYANGVVVADTASYVPQPGVRLSYLIVNGGTAITPVFRIGVGASSNATGSASFTQPQAELVTYQTTPGTYSATTASAYYGPRFDYDPVTLAPRGLLIEEARTNLLTYSEQFDNAAWTKVTVTATANTTTSPDGTVDADSLTASGGSAQHFINQSHSFISGTTYTLSVFAKKNTLNGVQLTFGSGAFGTLPYANFDLNAGTSFTSNCTATLTNFGNGWYRCTMTATANATTSAGAVIGLARDTAEARLATFSSDGNGIFLYGAQLEAGAFATSYIPTVASTVSRSADVATMTGTNFSTWYNQAEGALVVSCDAFSPASAPIIYAISDGTANNRIQSNADAGFHLFVSSGGVTQASIDAGTFVANAIQKLGAAYKLNDFAAVIDGGTVGTDASGTAPTVDRLNIGSGATGGSPLNGHIRAIAYYNTRLPNTQLQTLTAPSLASPLALDFLSTTYTVGY